MKRILLFLCLLVRFLWPEPMCARSVLARHEERFFKEVNRRSLAIALFYQDYRTIRNCDSAQADDMMRAERIFERVATISSLKEGGLVFIKASVLCDDMKALARSFGITRVPACVLFKDGELVHDQKGNVAILMTIRSQDSIVRFINLFLHNELSENREEYWHRQEVRALAGPQVSIGFGIGCWGPGWGYYDPYDYYPWQYYGGCGYGRGACGGGRRGCCSSGCHRGCCK